MERSFAASRGGANEICEKAPAFQRLFRFQTGSRTDFPAYIYTPYGLPIETDLSVMGDGPVRLSWYDPRTGEEIREKILPAKKALLVPPESGKGKDWIAVIDKLQEM